MVSHTMPHHDETFFKIDLEYMDNAKEVSRNAPLPYINLLTKVFEYFKVPLEDEDSIEVIDIVINEEKLEALKFKYTSSRQGLNKND